MLKKLTKAAVAAAAMFAGASMANAATVGSVNFTTNSTGGITVIAEDGQNYSKIETDDVEVSATLIVSMDTGKVEGYRVYIGACGALCPDGIGYNTLYDDSFWPSKMDLNDSFSFAIEDADIPQGLTQNLTASKMFQACQQRAGDSIISGDVTFTHYTPVTLSLDFEEPGVDSVADGYDHDWWQDYLVPVQVTCKALEDNQKIAEDFKFEHGDLKVNDIDLFLSTFSGATTQPNPATTCKKGRILVRVNTNKIGPTKFKLWTKIGGNTTSKVIDAWASHDGGGGFKAEHTEWVEVSEPTQVQAMAEDMVSDIGQTTQWKDIMLHCSSAPNGGGFVQDTIPPDNPFPVDPSVNPSVPATTTDLTPDQGRPEDPPANFQTLKGDFGIADYGAPKCERTAKALITFKSPKADNIHYSLDCKHQNKSGVLATQPHPDGGYMAATLVTLDVTQTLNDSCTLRTVAPYNPKDHVTKEHQFVCATPTGHTASTDLKPEPPQQPDSPSTGDRVPGKIVTPIPPRPVPPVIVTPVPVDPQRTGGAGTIVGGATTGICESQVCNCRNRAGWTIKHYRKFENGLPSWGYKCLPGASNDKTTDTGNADKQRIDALKIAKEKAEAERLRRAKIAAQKAKAERLRKAKIAAELAAKRKRQLEAANKARLLKLQQERARKAAAAAAQARANALRALTAKRKSKVKVAPRRRSTTTAPAINRMMMLRRR